MCEVIVGGTHAQSLLDSLPLTLLCQFSLPLLLTLFLRAQPPMTVAQRMEALGETPLPSTAASREARAAAAGQPQVGQQTLMEGEGSERRGWYRW